MNTDDEPRRFDLCAVDPVRGWAVSLYPAYRPSGVEWLGDVPAHWHVRPLKAWLGVNERVLPEETDPDYQFDYLDIGTVGTGRLLGEPTRLRFGDSPSRARRIVQCGDTIVSTVRTYLKAVWHAQKPGNDLIASTGFAVLTPRRDASPKFVSYCCQSDAFTNQVTEESVGIAYPAIAESKLVALKVCVPPTSEQVLIARFLDHATSRIERHIRAREKLIALLEEQQRAFVKQAVTGQIDVRTGRRYSAYRASGFDWFGEMPEHWQMVRNGRVFAQRNEIGHPELPILEVSLRTGVRLREFGDSGRKQVMSDRSLYKRAAKGDVTYNIMRMWQGAVGVAPTDGLVSPAYVVAKPMPGTDSRYFDHLYHTGSYMTEVDKYSRGIVKDRNRLYWEDFKQMPTPCPPSDEQTAIADAVDARTATTRACIRNIRARITRAREYQSRLVADVVTGKIDVRHSVHDLGEPAVAGSSGGCREGSMEATR